MRIRISLLRISAIFNFHAYDIHRLRAGSTSTETTRGLGSSRQKIARSPSARPDMSEPSTSARPPRPRRRGARARLRDRLHHAPARPFDPALRRHGHPSEMIAIAREKLAETECPELELRQATAETMARGDERFDAVLGFNYLHLAGDLSRRFATFTLSFRRAVSSSPRRPASRTWDRTSGSRSPSCGSLGRRLPSPASTKELEQAIRSAGFEILHVERRVEGRICAPSWSLKTLARRRRPIPSQPRARGVCCFSARGRATHLVERE